jgi:Fe-S-cluster containining protein
MKKRNLGSTRNPSSADVKTSAGVSGLEMDARRTQRLQTVSLLRTARTPLQVVQIAEQAVTVADEAVDTARTKSPPKEASACRKGCAWCCYKTVGTAAPEVLRIADYLWKTLSPDAFQALCERIDHLVEQRRKRAAQRSSTAPLPCGLLDNGRCLAYPVRPLTCRGYNSSDAQQCERSLNPANQAVVPVYAPQQRLTTFVLDGMRAGLAEARLPGELLELTAALRVALNVPDAAQRWLNGEAVFASARFP